MPKNSDSSPEDPAGHSAGNTPDDGVAAHGGTDASAGSMPDGVGHLGAHASSGADGTSEVAAGWRTVLPAIAAVVPLGLALGVLVVQSGLHWWWAPVLAAVVFAGSMEFLLVGLLAAGTPLLQIALSTLLVNFRHVFYALTFPLHQVKGKWWKAYSTFALTDESYALTAHPDSARWSRRRIITIQSGFHLGWVTCVTLGAGLGSLIPAQVVGLDFAVTALFLVLGMEAYKVKRSLPAPALALGCALVALLISRQNMLVIAMGLFTAALVCSYFVTRRRRKHA